MRSSEVVRFVFVAIASAGIVAACTGSDPEAVGGAGADAGPGGDRIDSGSGADTGVTDTDSGGTKGDGGTEAAAPLDVRTLPGLRLWLESTKDLTKASVGTDFVSWRDSSGRWADGGVGAPDGGAHIALPVAYNGGGAIYPSVITNAIAGRPAVSFETGPKAAIANHDDFNPGTGDFVIAAVAAVSSGSGPFWNLTTATTAPSGTWLGPTKFCSFLGGLGAQPQCTSPDYSPSTSAHVFLVHRKTAQAIFRVDGTSRGTYDYGVNNPNLGVQTYQQASAFIGGNVVTQLAELILLIGPTTDADLDSLEGYLKTKYAIP